jgi:hypothetical protein
MSWALTLWIPSLAAAEPLTLTHQMRAIGPAGDPVEGTHPVAVSLWNHATSTSPSNRLWLDTATVTFEDGYAALLLRQADDTTLVDSAWFQGDVWVDVAIDGTSLSPRTPVNDVPGASLGVASLGTRPTSPSPGAIFFNDTTKTLEVFAGGSWQAVRAYDPLSTSCLALRNSGVVVSGTYSVDPDGVGPVSPVSLFCDMTTDGGGWTRVFVASLDNYESSSLTYAAGTNLVLANSTTMMFAFVNVNDNTLTQAWKFPTPSSLVANARCRACSAATNRSPRPA